MSMDSIIMGERVGEPVQVETQDIGDLFMHEFDLLTYNQPGHLRFNDIGHYYNYATLPYITTDHVNITQHDEEGVKWEFNTTNLGVGVDAGTTQSASKQTSFKEKYKIRHEFVSEAISRSATDKRLREIFQEERDEDDELTPDFVWKDHRDMYYVLEVTTTRNNTEAGLKRAYDLKAFKYKYALETRAMRNKIVSFAVIVVSQDHIMSTLKLPRMLISELVIRMRIGLALENLAKSRGISLESEDTDVLFKAYAESIRINLEKVKLLISSQHDLTIKQDYVESVLRQPDDKEVLSIYLESIKRSKDQCKEERTTKSDPQKEIDKFIAKFSDGERKFNCKSVVQLPLFLTDTTNSSVDIPDIIMESDFNILESRIWSIAMDNFRSERTRNIEEDPLKLIQEALETDVNRVEQYQKDRKCNRSKYHRVNISSGLTLAEKEQAAEQGLWAKRHRNEPFYKERRKQSQKPFSWNTHVGDIDAFLLNLDLFKSTSMNTRSVEMCMKLLKHSDSLIHNNKKGIKSVESWTNTKIFRALDLISDVGMELCISNKQNCKQGCAILKKLRYHDAYLLVFPTKSNEHLFFTLYFPSGEILSEQPFRSIIKTKHGYLTPITSVKQGKLENWCNSSASLLSLAAFWSWFYELEEDTPLAFINCEEARKMLLFSILVRLEDKAQTEESITIMRYMYMESFKGLVTPILANPLKMLSKLSTRPKSRLNLWVIKTCVSNFHKMTMSPPTKLDITSRDLIEGEDSLPRDTWENLLNCFTGAPVYSASKIINLVYLGYLKNKNESAEGNTDFQLIEKTLEEELNLDTENISYSRGETPVGIEPKGKQFNKQCIMYGCYMMEKRLEHMLGNDWKTQLGNKIMENLASTMTETISSLKASCTLDHELTPQSSSLYDPKASMRCKVIEAISKNLDGFGLNPFTKLEKFISYIEGTSKGIIADLFKKQQHGGLREIYVLTIESRIIQLFIEVISRTICSYFDEETLTHPKNKLRKLNEHRRLSSRIAHKRNSLSIDLCSSNDKTRWNQNFVMTAMIIPLLRLTPKYYHNAIIRILNLWSNKLIKIPQSVCVHLLNRTPFSSEVFQTMSNAFWGPTTKVPIFDFATANCLRLKTGMMQGILHYTSSLLHLSFLHSSNKMIPMILQKWYPDYSFLMTQICSSDDSATMLSIFSPCDVPSIDQSLIKVACYSSLCLESLAKTCKYFCMQESLKTTTSLIDYVEFNSEFMFNNTIAMPIIKFVAASLNLTESESFLDRFYTQYNLISDLFASGFTAEHTHICQIAQGFLHYKTMGASTNALFDNWVDLIVQWPDPKYGYFLLDVDLMPGVLGYAYSHWNICTKSTIFQGTLRELNNEPWICTPDGGITQSLIMKHGEVIRWRKLVDNVKGDLDIKQEIERDPELLFRSPNTSDELKTKLAIIATCPGVAKSMRRGNPFIQSIAMSVYAINTHAFSKTTVTQDHYGRRKQTEKVCILGELDRLTKQVVTFERDFEESLLLAFPNKQKYEELQPLLRQMRGSILVPCHRLRERKNEIIIQPRTASLPLSLMQVLRSRWFGHPIRASHKIFMRCLDVYRNTIPWIRDDIKSCLEASPFTTYQELYNFISSNLEKVRVFRRNGPGIHSRRLTGQLYNLIRKSQRPCKLLMESEKRKYTIPSTDLITKVNLSLSIPERIYRETYTKQTLKNFPPLYDDLTSITSLTRREATLAYIQGILKRDFSMEEVAIHMRDLGIGTHVSYVQEQRKLIAEDGSVRWLGKGLCYVFLEGCQIQMSIKDENLVELRVDDWKRLKSNIFSFNQLCREMKIKPTKDSSRPPFIVAKYNGTHIITANGVGCPILKLSEKDRIKFDPSGLVMRIEQGEIKIIQKVFSVLRPSATLYEVCMLKYKMNHNDIILSKGIGDERDLWQAWVHQKPCSVDILFGHMKRSLRDQKSTMFKWLQESLQARLHFLSMGNFSSTMYEAAIEYSDAQEITRAEEEADEETFRMIQEAQYEMEGQEVRKLFKAAKEHSLTTKTWAEEAAEDLAIEEEINRDILKLIGMEDPAPLWVSHIKNWMEFIGEESTVVVGPAYGSFLCVHPLWDSVINGFYEERHNFWLEISDGVIPPNHEEVGLDLLKLLEIKERPKVGIVIGMSDRYKLAKEYLESPSRDLVSPREELEQQDIDDQEGDELDLTVERQDSPLLNTDTSEEEDIFEVFN